MGTVPAGRIDESMGVSNLAATFDEGGTGRGEEWWTNILEDIDLLIGSSKISWPGGDSVKLSTREGVSSCVGVVIAC